MGLIRRENSLMALLHYIISFVQKFPYSLLLLFFNMTYTNKQKTKKNVFADWTFFKY